MINQNLVNYQLINVNVDGYQGQGNLYSINCSDNILLNDLYNLKEGEGIFLSENNFNLKSLSGTTTCIVGYTTSSKENIIFNLNNFSFFSEICLAIIAIFIVVDFVRRIFYNI